MFKHILLSSILVNNRVIVRGGVEDTSLEAKANDRHFRGQGPRTQAQVFSENKNKKVFKKFFSGEKGLQKSFFKRYPLEENKKVLCKFSARFLAFYLLSSDPHLRKTKEVFANFSRDFWRFPTKFQRFKK